MANGSDPIKLQDLTSPPLEAALINNSVRSGEVRIKLKFWFLTLDYMYPDGFNAFNIICVWMTIAMVLCFVFAVGMKWLSVAY
jgi:hypothetical protein